mmetsp:Transcript_24249/g.61697  ORF Transcript_24249/g.61697 Transcript_24249/m.61697 type:complete len:228 (-) Transcript_24249:613-1296(-)
MERRGPQCFRLRLLLSKSCLLERLRASGAIVVQMTKSITVRGCLGVDRMLRERLLLFFPGILPKSLFLLQLGPGAFIQAHARGWPGPIRRGNSSGRRHFPGICFSRLCDPPLLQDCVRVQPVANSRYTLWRCSAGCSVNRLHCAQSILLLLSFERLLSLLLETIQAPFVLIVQLGEHFWIWGSLRVVVNYCILLLLSHLLSSQSHLSLIEEPLAGMHSRCGPGRQTS